MLYFRIVLVASIALWLVRKLSRRRRLNKLAAARGCKPGVMVMQPERVLGYHLLKGDMQDSLLNRSLQTALRRFRELGHTFSGATLAGRFITTIDSENASVILSSRFQDYNASRESTMGRAVGKSIFTSDGETWKESREMLKPHFFKNHIKSLDGYERNFQNFLARLPADSSTSIDLQPILAELSFDAITERLLGESVGTLDGDDTTPASKFASAFDFVRLRFMYLAPLNHYLRKMWYDPRLDEAARTAHSYVGRLVDEAVVRRDKRLAAGERRCEEQESVVDFLLNATDDLDRVRNELLSLLFAGRDPIADFTSNLFFVLSRHPDVWEKIRHEVTRFRGELTYEDLMSCVYVRNVMDEVMRLYPAIPIVIRYAKEDTVLPRGGGPRGDEPLVVPQGTAVSISNWAMGRNRRVWGDDVDEFRPERWLSIKGRRDFNPFGAGPRVCIGRLYTYATVMYWIARMAQEFEAIECTYDGPWKESWRVSLASGVGTPVRLHRRVTT